MPVHTGRLVLSLQDPGLLPDPEVLTAELAAAGFLGDPLPDREAAFAVGERFLQLITFAGCSVQIALSPSEDAHSAFCYIRIIGPFRRPRFLSGRNTRPPRCPSCRDPLRDWRQHLSAWESGELVQIHCPSCHLAQAPWAYDWKEKAGLGRLFVGIEEVFPGEAAPTPALMMRLEGITKHPWCHFYVQDA